MKHMIAFCLKIFILLKPDTFSDSMHLVMASSLLLKDKKYDGIFYTQTAIIAQICQLKYRQGYNSLLK